VDALPVPGGGAATATFGVGVHPQAFGAFIGPMMHTITVTPPTNGTLLPASGSNAAIGSDNLLLVADGLGQSFTLTPTSAYMGLTGFTVNGLSAGMAESPYPGTAQNYTALASITEDKTLAATFARTGWLVTLTKSAGGSITSAANNAFTAPHEFACTTFASCSGSTAYFKTGANVTLTAVLDTGYTSTQWTGCTTSSGTTCTITNLTADTIITANFFQGGPVSDGTRTYQSIGGDTGGYVGTTDGGIIKVKNATLYQTIETLALNLAKSVVLVGGYDDAFVTKSDVNPTRIAKLDINAGTINVENILIQP
jgi:hypothetical protein